jgi:glutamine cyclotransferase
VQLTWKEGTGFVYDLDLKPIGRFSFNGDGWGQAWDGQRLIESDGTDVLYFMDPKTYEDTAHIQVRDGGEPVYQLNELEVAKGRILANVWHSDRIAVIAPDSGLVQGWIDLAPLEQKIAKGPDWDPSDNVLNGIAWDPRSGHFYVTGKRWPKLFEIAVEGFGP